jgi:hypothetical protein
LQEQSEESRNKKEEDLLYYSFGLRGSILKSKIMNNTVTTPVPQISGSLVMFRSAPIISNDIPTNSKNCTILPNASPHYFIEIGKFPNIGQGVLPNFPILNCSY